MHDDGRVEISFYIQDSAMAYCNDWAKRSECPNSIIGYGHGISNPENTELDIRIEYKDCKDKIIDIGYMHLWKE